MISEFEEHQNESLFMHIWNSLQFLIFIVSNLPDPWWTADFEADAYNEKKYLYKLIKMNHVDKQLKQLKLQFQSSLSL